MCVKISFYLFIFWVEINRSFFLKSSPKNNEENSDLPWKNNPGIDQSNDTENIQTRSFQKS